MQRLLTIKKQITTNYSSNNSNTKNNNNNNNYPIYNLLNISTSITNKYVKIITINSPKNLNSLSDSLSKELLEAFEFLYNDNNTKVIILTGSGKSFIAGADIKKLQTLTYEYKLKHTEILANLINIMYSCKKPVIAAVNGFCFGGGFEMALNCDIILASEKAQFALPEIKLGLFPGLGGTQKLTKIVGNLKASEYILTGKNIPLEEALKLGIINQVYKHEDLMKKAEEMANTIANYSLVSVINAKQCIQMANEVGLKHGLWYEKSLFDSQFAFKDTLEGTSAFIDKRKPNFKDC